MASKTSVYQHPNGSHESLIDQSESTPAHDSHLERPTTPTPSSSSYLGLSRVFSFVPKFEKDKKSTSAFSRWLGRNKGKNSKGDKKHRISEPVPLPLPQTTLLPKRPLTELPLPPAHGSRILPELEAPTSSSSHGNRVQTQSPGKPHESLGSHPVGTWLDNMEKKLPPQKILLEPTSSNVDFRAAVNGEASQPSRTPVNTERKSEPTLNVGEKQTAGVKSERHKGRIFSNGVALKDLYEFPDPETWGGEDGVEGNDDDDGIWEDAGFDDVYEPRAELEPESQYRSIPAITITAPIDSENQIDTSDEMVNKFLAVDDCYKVLWESQKREVRWMRESVRYLLPLAWLVAEAEGVDRNDITALEDALKDIISDRDKLFDLYPLAQMLAKDQNVDVEDFQSLHRALRNVLTDRDNARRIAEYHRMAKQRLEGRVAQMERQRRGRYDEDDDDEEYIRL
ncbi:hypothetical protein F4776DRAFT_660403 [Hypoxylon sp. NC0597]|nr:hypothetical protein F4776DRAFT_660403 [Hypoxylon sp. NC0597]